MSKSKPKVLLLSVGGTIIAKQLEHNTLLPANFDKARLLASLPDIEQLADVDVLQLMTKESINLTPKDWILIGNTILSQLHNYDGIVVLHGLDTLPYTAAALSLMLQNLPIPIVITGSAMPLEFLASDGKRNLIDAICVAGTADLAEVCVVSDGIILRGNRIKKIYDYGPSTFENTNNEPIGYIRNKIVLLSSHKKRNPQRKVLYNNKFSDDVIVLYVYPGFNQQLLEHVLQINPKGVLVVGYTSGSIPVQGFGSFLPFLRKFKLQNGHLAVSTQILHGECCWTYYENDRPLLDIGAISTQDMTCEAAIVKFMWALGQSNNHQKVKTIMHTNYAGEITPDLMNGAEDKFL